MANFAYPSALRYMLGGTFGSSPLAGAVLKMGLFMSTSTAGTQRDAQTLADLTTLGELNGVNYSRKAVVGPSLALVDPTLATGYARIEIAANPTWNTPTLGPGSHPLAHVLLLADLNNDNANATTYLLYHWDMAVQPNFTAFNLVFGFDGLLTAKNA